MNARARACQCGLLAALVVLGSLNFVLAQEDKSFDHVINANGKDYEFQMMHRDYQNVPSPSSNSSSLLERYTNAAKRSRDRAKAMKQVVVGRNPNDFRASGLTGAVSPVFSQLGEYIMSISIGTPAKTFIAILDPGSDLVWVQCKPCKGCFKQPDPLFDPTKSSTYRKVNCTSSICSYLLLSTCGKKVCQYSYGYGDGSYTEGNLSLETITLTTTHGSKELVSDFAFGCGTGDGGDFSGSDGLVGLGRGPLSMMTQLAPKLGNKFSYCLVTFTDATTKTSPLILGDSQPIERGMKWTPLIRNEFASSFYYVGIEDISVGGKRLGIPKSAFDIDYYGDGGTILDSGTTLYFLDSVAYDPLEAVLKKLIQYPVVNASDIGFDLCYDLSRVKKPVFPQIIIHFTGADYVVPQNNVFALIDDEGTTCLGVIRSSDFSIFGNLIQQNFLFVYDVENEKLGFVPKQCDRAL